MRDNGERWYRFGAEPEAAEELEAACEAAARNGFPHGVSVRDRTRRPAASASREEVAIYFAVHKTGANPRHYTIELPHPVTEEVAERFNSLFGRLGQADGST